MTVLAGLVAFLILNGSVHVVGRLARHDCQYGPPTGRCMTCGASPEGIPS